MTKPLLHTVDLSVGYSAKKPVLSNVTVTVLPSELVMVAGRNGSGKSTLLTTILGLLPALSGDILIKGRSIRKYSHAGRSRTLSYVPSKSNVINNFTIKQIIETGRAPYTGWNNRFSEADRFHVDEATANLGLSNILHRRLNEVSDGERQKAMIARAIAQDAPIIILDEPTAFLDYPTRIELIQILKMLTREMKKAIVLSSHDLDILLPVVDSIWFCSDNGIVAEKADSMMQNNGFKMFFNKPSL